MKNLLLLVSALGLLLSTGCKKDDCMGKPNPLIDCKPNVDPVCGCNGITYSNACVANAHGVLHYTAGGCAK